MSDNKVEIDESLVKQICEYILKIEAFNSRRNVDSSDMIEKISKHIEQVVQSHHKIKL